MTDPNIAKLIEQMKPRRSAEKQQVTEKTTEKTTEKQTESLRSTIKTVEIDYYKVLGVEQTATALEIKRAYQSKLKKYHPDHAEPTKENKNLYDIVREAGDILTNVYERKAYDAQKKQVENTKGYLGQKESFKDFVTLQDNGMTEETKKYAKLAFDKGLTDLDKKHGYNKKDAETISKDEYDRRFEDLSLYRGQEDREIEMNTENMFRDRQFNTNEFNKVFERKKKRDEKRKINQGGLAKINNKQLSAFNDYDDASGGVGLDNQDSLYTDGVFSGMSDTFTGITAGMIGDDGHESGDDISLDSPTDDTYGANETAITKTEMENRLKEYQMNCEDYDKRLKKMTPDEYGSAIDDEYGISKQLGFMV